MAPRKGRAQPPPLGRAGPPPSLLSYWRIPSGGKTPSIVAHRRKTVNGKAVPLRLSCADGHSSKIGRRRRSLVYTKAKKGGEGMQVEVKLDPERKGDRDRGAGARSSPELDELVRRLESEQLPLRGWQEDTMTLLPQSQVVRCYAQDKRVYATVDGRRSICCGSGCMSWKSSWTGENLCASPTERSSIWTR